MNKQHQNAHIFLVKFKQCCGLISSTNDTDHKAPNKLHIVTTNNIIIKILIAPNSYENTRDNSQKLLMSI